MVHRATLPGQAVVRAPLDELAEAVRRAGVGPPAVVVIGDVVGLVPPEALRDIDLWTG